MKPQAAEQPDDREEGQEPQEKDGVVVNLEPPDDDGEPENREQRRSSYERLKGKLAERDNDIASLKEKLASLEGRVSAPPQQVIQQAPPQQQQQEDPDLAEARYHYQQGQTILRAIQQAVAQKQDTTQLEQQYEQADWARQVAAGRFAARQVAARSQQQQVSPEAQLYYAQHPDVVRSPKLSAMVQAEIWELREQRNIPQNQQTDLALLLEATTRVKARTGIGQPKPKPTEAEKAKYLGTNGKAGSSPGGKTMTLSKAEQKMALAYYSGTPHANKPPEEQFALYARKVLSKPD